MMPEQEPTPSHSLEEDSHAVPHPGPHRCAGQHPRARRDELRPDRSHHPGRGHRDRRRRPRRRDQPHRHRRHVQRTASRRRWSARPSPVAATTSCWRRRRTCRWATSATIRAVHAAGWSPSWTTACAASGVDHVDLYQIHRWDPNTSDEETLSALTDLQRAGKIRYFGSSTFPAYRIVQAQWAAREHHLGRYVTEQPSYSILQRGIETHVLPVTEQYGLGVLVWSPLASGWLSGAIRDGQDITTSRSAFMPERFDTAIPANRARLDAVEQLAKVADAGRPDPDPARARIRHRAPRRDQRDHRPPHAGPPALAARRRRHRAVRRRARRDRRDRRSRRRPGRRTRSSTPRPPCSTPSLRAPLEHGGN